jgi:hypothetical protein
MTPDPHKHDHHKPSLSPLLTIAPAALATVAAVRAYGRKKYPSGSELKVSRARYIDATLRHIAAYLNGESTDPESGLPHLAHAACSLLLALQVPTEETP